MVAVGVEVVGVMVTTTEGVGVVSGWEGEDVGVGMGGRDIVDVVVATMECVGVFPGGVGVAWRDSVPVRRDLDGVGEFLVDDKGFVDVCGVLRVDVSIEMVVVGEGVCSDSVWGLDMEAVECIDSVEEKVARDTVSGVDDNVGVM